MERFHFKAGGNPHHLSNHPLRAAFRNKRHVEAVSGIQRRRSSHSWLEFDLAGTREMQQGLDSVLVQPATQPLQLQLLLIPWLRLRSP
jgi:hypothetical protein